MILYVFLHLNLDISEKYLFRFPHHGLKHVSQTTILQTCHIKFIHVQRFEVIFIIKIRRETSFYQEKHFVAHQLVEIASGILVVLKLLLILMLWYVCLGTGGNFNVEQNLARKLYILIGMNNGRDISSKEKRKMFYFIMNHHTKSTCLFPNIIEYVAIDCSKCS